MIAIETIDTFCELFYSKLFASVTIQSYADETTDAASYLTDLNLRYDMLPHADNVIIYFAKGHRWSGPPMVSQKEDMLIEAIRNKVIDSEEIEGTVDLILDCKPELGKQIEITVVATDVSILQ